jgi:hypothetical protein
MWSIPCGWQNNRKGEPPYFLYMDNTETGTKALDDYTVEIVFTQFNVSYENSFATIFMVDKESYDPEKVAYETNGTVLTRLQITLSRAAWISRCATTIGDKNRP